MNLAQAIYSVAEISGNNLSEPVVNMMLGILSSYPEEQVFTALEKYAKHPKGRFTIGELISLIEGADGRISADEAWSMGIQLFDESRTHIIPSEVLQAMEVAYPLESDKVAARMAFKERYNSLVAQNREESLPMEWTYTLGYLREGRYEPIIKAVADKKLDAAQIKSVFPHLELKPSKDALQITSGELPSMSQIQNAAPPEIKEQIRKALGRIGK